MIAQINNLEDQLGQGSTRTIMVCQVCPTEYSAQKGDYWDLPEDYVFTHHAQPMMLAKKKTVIELL